MIYGITGLPGNGKTLYALWWVKQKAESEARPVWYHGINGLTLPWHKLPTDVHQINGQEVEVPRWWEAPTGSIVIIDEAQNCGFGVRGRGQVPEWARKLETHRHLGIDLVFITQSPMLLDSHDRALVGTHFHIVRNFGLQRATVHEFQQLRDDVLKRRTGSVRHEWRYPREVFGFYKSAEAHTYKSRIPARLWLLLALPVLIVAIVWFIAMRWQSKIQGTDPPAAAPGQAAASAPGQPARPAPRGPMTRDEYVGQFVPRVAGLAYTAPAYDEVTKPTQAPYPAACLSNRTRCQCYTQQGTYLDVGGESLCRQISAGGFFVAWQVVDGRQVAQVGAAVGVSPVAPAVSLGGNPRAHILPGSAQATR